MAAAVAEDGVARKLAAAVPNVGLVADQTLGFLRTLEVDLRVLRAVRLYEGVKLDWVVGGSQPGLIQQRLFTPCRQNTADRYKKHPCEKGSSHEGYDRPP
ncbi:MAG TPA: hypothetical protein VM842_03735 [Nitrospira sp.]|nr:hypothetical protein [Nitrospira sp.]